MESKVFNVSLAKNPKISGNVISGHFATNKTQTHVSHYLDVSTLKSNALIAHDVARELAAPYLSSTSVDTIVCMDKTEVIGAYLAEELQSGGINRDHDIYVLTPTSNVNHDLIFQDNMLGRITDRNVILLTAWIVSGLTMGRALECFAYYGGRSVGISTLFLAQPEKWDDDVHTLFTSKDIPNYKLFNPSQCEMCKAGLKLDAIVSYDGYTNIRGLS